MAKGSGLILARPIEEKRRRATACWEPRDEAVVRPGLHLAKGFPRNFAERSTNHRWTRQFKSRAAPSPHGLSFSHVLSLSPSLCLSLQSPLFTSLDRDNLQFYRYRGDSFDV